jgi:hypothetical protein
VERENAKVVVTRHSAFFCFPESCLTFVTADPDKECRRSARHIGKAARESEEGEAADSVEVRSKAKNKRGNQRK